MRNVAATDPELDWLNTLLRLHLDPWLLLEAITNSQGSSHDFVVQDASTTVDAGPWIGRRLLEIWPSLADDGTAESLGTLVRAGGSWSATVGEPSAVPWGSRAV